MNVAIRTAEIAPWLRETPMQVLQQTLRELDRAWGGWAAKGGGMPRFKKRSREQRLCDAQGVWARRSSKRFGIVKIQGVGPAKKRALLRKFGSVRGMREASEADLALVAGVGAALAERIKQAID